VSTVWYTNPSVSQAAFVAALEGSDVEIVVTEPKYTCWHRLLRHAGGSAWVYEPWVYGVKFELFLPQTSGVGLVVLQRVAQLLRIHILHEYYEALIAPSGELLRGSDTAPRWTSEQLALWDQPGGP
jgi:hypothetical protein